VLPAKSKARAFGAYRRIDRMFKKFLKDESGLELSEYAVAAALVALAAVAAFQLLGGNIAIKINELAGKLQ
jgi:pilus assembly protein Flp/PilA